MNKYKILLISILTAYGVQAQAAKTGNDLYKQCSAAESYFSNNSNSPNQLDIIGCVALVDGFKHGIMVSHALYKQEEAKGICLPDGANTFQLVSVINKWLRDNPQDRHLEAYLLMMSALYAAYPCQ